VWDNPSHNNTRKACFKSLAAACLAGLKRRPMTTADQRTALRERLRRLVPSSPELELCIKHLDNATMLPEADKKPSSTTTTTTS
jgi:hypothetical protein